MSRTQTARAYFGLETIEQDICTSCDEHGGYHYNHGRRSPRYYGYDGCDECDRNGWYGYEAGKHPGHERCDECAGDGDSD